MLNGIFVPCSRFTRLSLRPSSTFNLRRYLRRNVPDIFLFPVKLAVNQKCTLCKRIIYLLSHFCLAVNACPFTFFVNKLVDSYSCKTTAVANYLNEVLRLSPIPNSIRLADGKCTAEISRHNPNDGLKFKIAEDFKLIW